MRSKNYTKISIAFLLIFSTLYQASAQNTRLVPQVVKASAFAETRPVREFGVARPEWNKESRMFPIRDHEINEKNEEVLKNLIPGRGGFSSGIQNSLITEPNIPAPILSFDGISSNDNLAAFGFRVAPPDCNGDVGPNHYIQTVNLLVGIYNKTTGALVVPKFKMSTLFAALGPPASTRDDGDPIVIYDQLADRWLISQFNTASQGGRTSQCIAISKTGDPTGAYYVYNFVMPNVKFNDYPHFGMWPDGYYMTDNQFSPGFTGAGAFAFDRAKMLVGDPTASYIYFDQFPGCPTCGGQLPTDLEGYVAPPVGTPNLFMEFRADEFGDPNDALRIFAFHADFVSPGSSTFTQVGTDLVLTPFDARNPAGRTDIDQPAPGEKVDGISDRLMYRLNCRILPGGLQSYTGNFTVNVSGVNPTTSATYQAGIRWFELRRNAGTGAMSVNQQGTYAPGAGDGAAGRDIWMGSVNQDNEGNIALGFSASSVTLNPSVLYTGRLAGDPLGTLPQGEGSLVAGGGVQTATANRWGDYSSMSLDPTDEITFWYTQEYYIATGSFTWATRIGKFKVNAAGVASPRGTIVGTVTNCTTGLPIQNAVVTTPNGFMRQTDALGQYTITAAPGTYTINITAPGGFNVCTTNGVVVTNGGVTVVNCCLVGVPIMTSAGATLVSESCAPPNGSIDPNETVTVSFCVQNVGGDNTTNLVGTLQATGGVTSPSGPQNYGVVVAGGPPVCRNFTFTAQGLCGGTITASIQLQDGATNLGTLTYTFTLGTLNVAFTQNFDGVVAPALPAGWTVAAPVNVTGAPLWVTSNSGTPAPPAVSLPNSIFSTDPANLFDNRIETPAIAITSASAQLTFRNNFDLEPNFDGGVLEISIPSVAAGAFQDILVAGGTFVTGGYTGTISTNFANPIAGRQAWTGSSAGFITTTVNLPAAANGQNIKLRFRMGADNSVSAVGWRVDDVLISSGYVCCQSAIPCTENFDGVTAPALPAGWTATTAVDCATSNPWATVSTTSDSPPNSAFVSDPNCISDERLDSRIFPIISASAVLTFRNNFNLETGFDGMVLEISIGGGPFQDILAAGGTFGTGGYNGTISVNFGNPIGGRQAWTGNSAGFITTTVNLPASANGQNIVLRWRRGADSSVPGVGAFIDGISIIGSNCAPTCTLTCPPNQVRTTDPGQCGAVVTYPAPTTTGPCGTVVTTPASGSFFPRGTTTVTATSQAGNTCTFTVTVNDNQAPTITCPANITRSTDPNQCGALVTFVVTATDNCPGVTIVSTPASGSFFPKGTTTVTSTATDASGNTATCTFTVTVNDTQPPSITCPANITATTPIGLCTAVVSWTIVATDNCPGVTSVSVPPSGSTFPIGTTTVTSTATDASGNTATCSFTVTVLDGQLPVITTQPANRTVCVGSSASFNVVATNAVSYQWQQFNGSIWVNIAGATGASYTIANVVQTMNTNTFRVNVIGLCTTVTSGFATLYVNPLPTIILVPSRPPVLLPGQTLTLTATVNPTGGTFVWFKNGVVIPGVTGGTLSGLTVDDIGTYRAVYTDLNGCTATSADITVSGQPSGNLWVYPNPNNGQFQVRFYNAANEQATINIYDEKGSKVYSRAFTTAIPYTRLDVDISRMPSGKYLVEVVNSANKRVGAKWVIVNR